MALVPISIDVYCTSGEQNPAYRVYVDDDLLTERSWVWPTYEVYIKEIIEVDLEPGTHYLRIDQIAGTGKFTTKNFVVNGALIENQDLSFNI